MVDVHNHVPQITQFLMATTAQFVQLSV